MINRSLLSVTLLSTSCLLFACSQGKSSASGTQQPASTDNAQGKKSDDKDDDDDDDDGKKSDDKDGGSDNQESDSEGSLSLILGTWVGVCEKEETETMPVEVYYKKETLTFTSKGTYVEEEEQFSDQACSTKRVGGDKKVTDKGNNLKVDKEISSDKIFVKFKRVEKWNDETNKLESAPEDLTALIEVKDSTLKMDKKGTASGSFTEKAETFEKD